MPRKHPWPQHVAKRRETPGITGRTTKPDVPFHTVGRHVWHVGMPATTGPQPACNDFITGGMVKQPPGPGRKQPGARPQLLAEGRMQTAGAGHTGRTAGMATGNEPATAQRQQAPQ